MRIRLAPKIGVTRGAGSTFTSGIGTITFIITYSKGVKHKVILDNVIHLEYNIYSKWSDDKWDNCDIMFQGKFSISMWNNDKYKKHITHLPNFLIPFILFNEADDAFIIFNSIHSTHYPENGLLIPDGVYPPID